MEARSKSQLLVSLTLLSVLYSQTLALPLEIYSTMSKPGNGMLLDAPNESDQNLGLLKVENYLESLLPENDLSFLYAPKSSRRQADVVLTSELKKVLKDKHMRDLIKELIKKPESGEKSSK
ncbi:VIP peptides-like [Petaurus breviceps papuanus]|uniref:VIP peptides-like n=1 Tax=Petaurus breviceps papuanus TaxID=3040969 RepID=UPI0036DD529E